MILELSCNSMLILEVGPIQGGVNRCLPSLLVRRSRPGYPGHSRLLLHSGYETTSSGSMYTSNNPVEYLRYTWLQLSRYGERFYGKAQSKHCVG